MKFIGVGTVWDKEKQKVLCEFEGMRYDSAGNLVKGSFETNDSAIIAKLLEAGYKPEGGPMTQVTEVPKSEPEPEVSEVKEDKPKAGRKPKAE